MTLTIELPEKLTHKFQAQKISENEIKAVALAALEIWLTQDDSRKEGRFSENARPFVQRLIANNRELFGTLAKR